MRLDLCLMRSPVCPAVNSAFSPALAIVGSFCNQTQPFCHKFAIAAPDVTSQHQTSSLTGLCLRYNSMLNSWRPIPRHWLP